MKRVVALLASTSVAVLGPNAHAQAKVDLGDAIDALLSNGCTGTGGVGLLSAGDFTDARTITHTTPTTSYVFVPRLVDGNGVRQPVSLYTGPFVDESGDPVDASATVEKYLNRWLGTSNGPISTSAAVTGTDAAAGDIVVDIRAQLNLSGKELIDESLDPFDPSSYRKVGGRFVEDTTPSINPLDDPTFTASGVEAFPGFLPKVADPSTLGVFRTASDIVLSVTAQWTTTVTNTRTVLTGQGRVGSDLARICSSTTTASRANSASKDFTPFVFNTSAGIRTQTQPGLTNQSFAGGPRVVATGQGLASALRAQDTVVRREKGVWAFFERLKRKSDRQRAGRTVQLASNDPTYVPATSDPRRTRFVTDVSGGIVNLERAPTDLEGAFNADSVIASIGGAIVHDGVFSDNDSILVGLSAGYESTDSTAEAVASTDRGDSLTQTWSGSAVLGWTSSPFAMGFDEQAELTATLLATYGEGDQKYDRTFGATYTPVTTNDQPTEVSVSDALHGSLGQTYRSFSLQLSLAQPVGAFVLSPRASISSARFETGGYTETLAAADTGGNAGLALRYDPVEDEWTEFRAGGQATLRVFTSDTIAVDLGAGVDAIFVGDAETPRRRAFFVQDLRPTPIAILYDVDDLDDQYFDINASVSAQFANGAELFLNGFSRQGHDYIDAVGAIAGLRFNF